MSLRAIVSGAGIGGLATALALLHAKFDVTIYERANALEEFGAGLQLTPNATRILARFEVLDAVRSIAAKPEAVYALRGSDDALLIRMTLADAEKKWGAPYLVLHRADLQRVLAEAVQGFPNARLQLGSTVAGLAKDGDLVSVGLRQGGANVGDRAHLLIGADGVHSLVRERLGFGTADKARFTGCVAFRAIVDSNRVESTWRRPDVFLRLGPKAHLVHYALRGGTVVNLVAVIETACRGGECDHPRDRVSERLVLDRAFAGWSDSVRGLLSAATKWRAWPIYGRSPIATFSLGCIALVGDAAHPMVPFLAQGAAQAIEDAGTIQDAFSRTSAIHQALATYSRRRVARAMRVQVEAQRQGRIYHLGGPAGSARDLVMRLVGPQRLSTNYDWLYGA